MDDRAAAGLRRMVVTGLRRAKTMLEELFDEAAEAAREAHQHAA